ncbi:putative SAM-dependent methyltransferase [Thozetella sp. PMI_491]|nr:putative SAM-dependent methyltransferase [Thozetella sp. PMI_491]
MASAPPPPEVLPLSAAETIASYAIPNSRPEIEVTQAEHRIRLINAWSPAIVPGTRVLELGCGQGTATQALAEAVGESGHIDAVDPGSLDYGGPFTLGQAQGHISKGPIGGRITWHQADPVTFLQQHPDTTWDVAVLLHCIWYFKSPDALVEILNALKGRVKKVLVAEHALHATEKAAIPHVLATLARATLEAHRGDSSENIQNPLSPSGIKEIAAKTNWSLEAEATVVPDRGLDDGRWETGTVASARFLDVVEKNVQDERIKLLLRSARDAVLTALATVGGEVKNAQTMDTWVAAFVPA